MLAAAAEAVLRANWRQGTRRDGTPLAFTCPAPRRYKHQWYWDSCFHAIAWTHFDRARAKEELRTLLRAGRRDGFVPHTAFWGASPRWRRAPLYATQHFRCDTGTGSIQTPLLAVAWERVAAGDDAFRIEGLEPLAAHARRLIHERDPDGDGLITILLPDEADRLAQGVADAATRSGFREYHHPRTGSGHGEHRFGWSTLLLDLLTGFSVSAPGVAPKA